MSKKNKKFTCFYCGSGENTPEVVRAYAEAVKKPQISAEDEIEAVCKFILASGDLSDKVRHVFVRHEDPTGKKATPLERYTMKVQHVRKLSAALDEVFTVKITVTDYCDSWLNEGRFPAPLFMKKPVAKASAPVVFGDPGPWGK